MKILTLEIFRLYGILSIATCCDELMYILLYDSIVKHIIVS